MTQPTSTDTTYTTYYMVADGGREYGPYTFVESIERRRDFPRGVWRHFDATRQQVADGRTY